MSEPPRELFDKIVLADLLDESIVGAKSGEPTFPLRVLLGELATKVTEDHAFAFASGLNFFFRSEMDEEAKLKVGVEVSRAYYAFTHANAIEEELVRKASPLLASLMSGELQRVKLESVDHQKIFDSAAHEREQGAHAGSSKITRPASFLSRVAANGVVRTKARVFT